MLEGTQIVVTVKRSECGCTCLHPSAGTFGNYFHCSKKASDCKVDCWRKFIAVEQVTQVVLGFGKGDRATARGEEILNFQFIPWRTTIVEGKTKICSVDSSKVESIEAELMEKKDEE